MKSRSTPSVPKGSRRHFSARRILQNWQLYLLLVLPLAYIIIFKYVPIYGAQIAFRDYSPILGFWKSPWVGTEHFERFFSSPVFSRILVNTLLLSLYNLIASFPFPIILAIGINYVGNKFFKKTVQMVTYIPYFISVVVLVGILTQIMNPRFGIVNQVITALGGEAIDFFAKPEYFRSLYVWSNVWQQAGWGSIIYIAALSGIDPQLHEAAIVDGASITRRIWHIDIPGILPTAIIMLILNVGSFMTLGFEKAYLMQNTMNTGTSEIIDTYVYKIGLASQSANFSYSSAIGLFQSAIGFILTLTVNKIANKLTETSLW